MTRITIGGFVTALSGVCVLGVTCLGHCLLRAPGAPAPPARARDALVGPSSALDAGSSERAGRVACAGGIDAAAVHVDDAGERTDPGRALRTSEQRALFLAGLEREEGGLAAAARRVLAGSGPDYEKVDVLHALITTRSSEACDILAEAVAAHPDTSGPHGESVPRCALRLLAEQARSNDRARATLERIAWTGPATVASGLRASAAASLAAVASGAEAWRVAGHLQIERDPLVRAAGAEAMSRNADPTATEAFRALGIAVAGALHDPLDG